MTQSTRRSIFLKTLIAFIIPTVVFIYVTNFGYNNLLILQIQTKPIRGVFVTLIRSTNRSIFLTINMIHSVIHFYPTHNGSLYPFIIFHDENFTSDMRQQILSCVLQNNRKINISFALANFQTSIQPSNESRLKRPMGYRLMCRFWTYDIFYHAAIRHGSYDYLMRMDDDSYFSNVVREDLFLYMKKQKLDYLYRSSYEDSFDSMHPILQHFLNKINLRLACIYNNMFVIRLKWYYESKRVQSFVHELIRDNLMLREYIGDGCVHSAMLEIDNRVKFERLTNVSYGHNFHVMPSGYVEILFRVVKAFDEEMNKSCQQLTVLRGFEGTLARIKMFEEMEFM